MKSKRYQFIVALSLMLSGVFPIPAGAESALEALKAIAQGAKVFEEKIKANSVGPMESTASSDRQSPQNKVDVVGISLGMTAEEALLALKKHNPKLAVIEVKKTAFEDLRNPNHPTYVLLQDAPNNHHERFTLFVSLPPKAQIIEIQREVIYEKGNAPTRDSALSAAADKYGNPSKNQKEYQFSILTWYFGAPPKGQYIDGCHPKAWSVPTIAREPTRPNCSMVLTTRVDADSSNPGLASKISITLTDHRLIYELQSESRQVLVSMAKKRQSDEIGRAAGNAKPRF